MITFKNPGLIDMLAVTTMGVSVKNPGSFGYFGTGLKYSIATILRGGGAICIWRGLKKYSFTVKKQAIRSEEFELVCLNGKPLGFTTSLGRNWEPWMILRELGCNARDEGGFFQDTSSEEILDHELCQPEADHTTVQVWWDKLDAVLPLRSHVFAEGDTILEVPDQIRVLPGPSNYIYYRGIRVLKLQRPSVMTYDILEHQTLTEDRSLLGDWNVKSLIRNIIVEADNQTFINEVVTSGNNTFEGSIDFTEETAPPSRTFMDTVLDARQRKDHGLISTCRALVMKLLRSESTERVGGGYYSSYRSKADRISEVIEALGELGLDLDAEKIPIILVDELTGDAKTLTENGRIYVLRSLAQEKKADIALELAHRILDLSGHVYADDMRDELLPLLLRQHQDLAPYSRDADLEVPKKAEPDEADTYAVELEPEMPF